MLHRSRSSFGLCVRAGPVNRWHRDIDQTEVHGELTAMVDQMIDGLPDYRAARHREDHVIPMLQ